VRVQKPSLSSQKPIYAVLRALSNYIKKSAKISSISTLNSNFQKIKNLRPKRPK